jgi:hypothetical protein
VLILCLSVISQVKEAETSSDDLEKELRATLESYRKAVNERDFDTMDEIEGVPIGYGSRSKPPRLWNKKFLMFANKLFLNSMEIYEIIPVGEDIVRVVGDVGLVLENWIEQSKPKGGELKSIEVRSSLTFIRVDGEWKLALYHRDVQFSK